MMDAETERYIAWIREGLKATGQTQSALAKHLNIAHPQITMLLRGNRRLKVDEVPRIADFLGIAAPSTAATATRVPIVSWVSAGNLRDQPGVGAADIERWINVGDLPPGDWMALVVRGDSMDRIAPDGSIILVNRADSTLIDSRFYVFAMNGGEATFKQWRNSPQEHLRPYSYNLDHMPIPANDDLYVFGRVRRIITDV